MYPTGRVVVQLARQSVELRSRPVVRVVAPHPLGLEVVDHETGQIKLRLKVTDRPITDQQAGPGPWGVWKRKKRGVGRRERVYTPRPVLSMTRLVREVTA